MPEEPMPEGIPSAREASKRPRVLPVHAQRLSHVIYYESADVEATAERYGRVLGLTESSFVARNPFWVSFAGIQLRSVHLSRSLASAAKIKQVPADMVMLIISERGGSSIEARGTQVFSRNRAVAMTAPLDAHLYQSIELAEDFLIETNLGEMVQHVAMENKDHLIRRALSRPLDFDLTSVLGAQCYRTFHFVWNQLTGPSMSPPPVLEAAYEELLLNAMSMLLAPALTDGSDRFDLGSALIQRACEIIKAQAAEPIRIADIAIALGVSTRHLQAGFRRYLNTTPQRFLSDCRLERARSMLQLSLPHETVTQIAFECGFGHLGEFSMRYRSRFGESPSETFRRARVVG